MIEQFDLFFGRDIYTKFDNVLNDVDDMHFVPVELAISARRDRKEGNLDMPFISVDRPPFSPNQEAYNSTSALNGIPIPAPNSDTYIEMYGLGFETTYTLNYWDDLQNTANAFNERWIELAQSERKIEFDVPVAAGDVDDTFPFGYTMQLGELTDNSDIARQHEHGADIRYTGDVKIDGLIYQFEPDPTEAGLPRIETILIDFYRGEFGSDKLIDELVVD